MTRLSFVIVALITLAFAVTRFFVPSRKPDFGVTGLYKTAAHFFTAWLIGYAIGTEEFAPAMFAVGLTGVEIIAFVTQGGGK